MIDDLVSGTNGFLAWPDSGGETTGELQGWCERKGGECRDDVGPLYILLISALSSTFRRCLSPRSQRACSRKWKTNAQHNTQIWKLKHGRRPLWHGPEENPIKPRGLPPARRFFPPQRSSFFIYIYISK